jgi:hypothetical protein
LRGEGQVFVVGGNENTLAAVSSLRPGDGGTITARLIPLARTPLGVAIGDKHREAGIAFTGIFEWIDRTFSPEDENAFVASIRDLELLARVGWDSPFPERIGEGSVINLEDLPADVADGLAAPAVTLAACAICRRPCVRDDFEWNAKQLCAWDHHAQVFGKRGPWHEGAYEERHFETVPSCAYVAEPLLAELGVEAQLTGASLEEPTVRAVVNTILEADPSHPHMAVRTAGGVWVLREV